MNNNKLTVKISLNAAQKEFIEEAQQDVIDEINTLVSAEALAYIDASIDIMGEDW